MQQREAAPDHRVADLAHRHRPRHRARPAQPQQLVLAGELVDRGAAVHPRDVVPQRQRLGVAQHTTDAAAHDQPLAQRRAVALHRLGRRRWTRRPPAPWAAGATGPRRPPGVPGTRRRPPARCRPCRRRAVRGRCARSATSPRRRGPGRPAAGSARWRSRCRPTVPSPPAADAGTKPVGAPAQRRDVARQPGDRPPAVLDECGQLGAVGVDHPHAVAERRRRAAPSPHRCACAPTRSTPPPSRRRRWRAACSALSRAVRPSSHASRQPVSRSR